MAEVLPLPTDEIAPPLDASALDLARSAMQQEVLFRGDRQLPEEPNRGFSIERQDSEHTSTIESAVPNNDDSRAEQFAESFANGTTQIEIVKDAWSGTQTKGEAGFVVYLPVAASAYKAAVEEGVVKDGLFGHEGKIDHTEPGASLLGTLVDPRQRQEKAKAYYLHGQAEVVQRNYKNDFEQLTPAEFGSLREICEAYDFIDSDKSIRLLNLSHTRLSDEQLRQAANTIRSATDKSGGELFEHLKTILILPEDNPSLIGQVKDQEGALDLPYMGGSREDTIFISERALQQPEDRKQRSERVEKYWARQYDQYLLPGEPTEGPDRPHHNASRFEWEIILAHELEHAALKANNIALPGPGTTLYSRFSKREHEAELAALAYKGGEEAQAVPEEQWLAKQEMWGQQRGTPNGGRTFKQPLGPHFITCRQLDLAQGPLPLRPRNPDKPLKTEIIYRLIPNA